MKIFAMRFLCLVGLWPISASGFIMDVPFSKCPEVLRVDHAADLSSDAVLSFKGLVERHGYTAEEHAFSTSDGYRLVAHRIIDSPASERVEDKPIVYLQHGMLGSSDAWVLIGPEQSLAFLLADAGYDVWFGNYRGNTYCRSHERLSTSDRDFWQFSFHEIGIEDIASTIDYILNATDKKTLNYIGHSMGTTVAFVLLSMKPSYNDKIRLLINFAPVAYWKHAPTLLITKIISSVPYWQNLLEMFQIYDLAPQSTDSIRTARYFCSDNSFFQPICMQMMSLFSDLQVDTVNKTWVPQILAHYPAGASIKTILHYLQNMRSGDFQAFDYGDLENYFRYEQLAPPHYNVSQITAAVAIFYGMDDRLVSTEDVQNLYEELPRVVAYEGIPGFTHMAFLYHTDGKERLYQRVLQLLQEFDDSAETDD